MKYDPNIHYYYEWDKYFLNLLRPISMKSRDRRTKVGCVIVDEKHSILSTGFNGFPRGVDDSVAARYEKPLKYKWTVHADMNGILNAARRGVRLEGATMYLPWYPCSNCTMGIIQSGIDNVVIDGRKYEEKAKHWKAWESDVKISRQMLKEANVDLWVWSYKWYRHAASQYPYARIEQ